MIENEIEAQGLSTEIAGNLSHRQVQNKVKLYHYVRCGREDQGQSPTSPPQPPLNQCVLHYLWPKCGDLSLNGVWDIVRASLWLIHRRPNARTHRDAKTQTKRVFKGQNCHGVKIIACAFSVDLTLIIKNYCVKITAISVPRVYIS